MQTKPTLNPDEMRSIIEEAADEHGGELDQDYSGRGMMGKTCFGIVTNNPSLVIREAEAQGLTGARQDRIGLRWIVYWPHVPSTSQETEPPVDSTDVQSSDLDGLPWEQRRKYCYCDQHQSHCGECVCGKPGHVRSLMMLTACWCDASYREACKSMKDQNAEPCGGYASADGSVSDTPRTDAAEYEQDFTKVMVVESDFARGLEREIATYRQAQAEAGIVDKKL